MSIRAICFDLDGVYFTGVGKQSFHKALSEEYGASPEAVDAFMYRSDAMAQLVRGTITPAVFFEEMRATLGITASDDQLAARWVRDYVVDPEIERLVHQVREQGYKTCVCTNNNSIRLTPLIETFHLREKFDVIISSHEVGHTKPEPEIFSALLTALNVEPEELLYADDNPARLEGAQELGIQTFVYQDREQCIGELKKRGVSI